MRGCDQRAIMGKGLGAPVAVVSSAEERFVDLDYANRCNMREEV